MRSITTSFQTWASTWGATISLTSQLTASQVSDVINSELMRRYRRHNTIGSCCPAATTGFYTIYRVWIYPHLKTSTITRTPTAHCADKTARVSRRHCLFHSVHSSLQTLHGPRWTEREAEAEAHPDHVHQRAAEGAGAGFCWNALPGHLHPRGAGTQNRPDWSQGSGTDACPLEYAQLRTSGFMMKIRIILTRRRITYF